MRIFCVTYAFVFKAHGGIVYTRYGHTAKAVVHLYYYMGGEWGWGGEAYPN